MSAGAFWIVSASPEQTRAFGRVLGELLRAPLLIWLAGDLGAGKTCLTQGLAQGLGVAADEPVTSPSYTLMNQYRGRLPLYHFDLYRLNRPEDLDDLDFASYLDTDGVTVVEWADRFGELEGGGLRIRLTTLDENRRRIELHAGDSELEELAARLRDLWRRENPS